MLSRLCSVLYVLVHGMRILCVSMRVAFAFQCFCRCVYLMVFSVFAFIGFVAAFMRCLSRDSVRCLCNSVAFSALCVYVFT